MSAGNTSSSLKYSPHSNWVELPAQERFLLILIHMRMLFPVTSQQRTLCQLWSLTPWWDGWKSQGGRCELAGGEQTASEDFSQSRGGQPAGGKHTGHKGKEKQVAAKRFAFQRPAEPLRTNSSWAQASTSYRKHPAWWHFFSFNLKFTQLLESWNSLPVLLSGKSWNKLGWFWNQWCDSVLSHYQPLCKAGNKTFPASLSDPSLQKKNQKSS